MKYYQVKTAIVKSMDAELKLLKVLTMHRLTVDKPTLMQYKYKI